jgi:hypothetical protein
VGLFGENHPNTGSAGAGPTVIPDDLGKINGCRYQIISMGESVIRPVRWAAG